MAVDTQGSTRKIAETRKKFLADWLKALDAFNAAQEDLTQGIDPILKTPLSAAQVEAAKKSAVVRLMKTWQSILDAGYRASYAEGRKVWGPGQRPASNLGPEARARLRQEKGFATRFALEMSQPRKGRRMPAGTRSALYGNALEGAFNRGAVDNAPPGQLIWWVLGDARHCLTDKDTLVTTRRGQLPICEVVPGDEVLTHRDRWRPVSATHKIPIETASTNLEVTFRTASGDLKVTADHKLLTEMGWEPAFEVASGGRHPLELSHDTLRKMRRTGQVQGPYDLPPMSIGVHLRPSESPAGLLSRLCCRSQGGTKPSPDEGPGFPRSFQGEDAGCRHCSQGQAEGRHGGGCLRGEASPGGGFPSSHEPLTSLCSDGGFSGLDEDRLSISVGLGAGERPDSRRDGCSPPERGLYGRSVGEPGVAARPATQEIAQTYRGGVGPRHRVSVRYLRRNFLQAPREGAVKKREEVLLPAMSGQVAFSPLQGKGGSATWAIVPPGSFVYDLTVEEDHSFLANGFVVANCSSCPGLAASSPYTRETIPTTPRSGATPCGARCRCWLSFAPVQPKQKPPEEQADDKEKARPIEERLTGPKPVPPPGKRLPTEEEDKFIRDLEARMAFANRRAAHFHDLGDSKSRDQWLKTRKELNGELIEFQKSRGIWAPPTFSDSEVLRGVDLREEDVSWLTHLRGIDGTTVHRAQADAISKAVEDSTAGLTKLLADLPASADAVPDFDDLLRRFGAPESGFTGSFDSAPKAQGHLHEAAGSPDSTRRVVMQLVGFGAEATLKIIPTALKLLSAREYDLNIGPLGDGWELAALRFGVWLEGEEADVERLVKALGRRVEAVPWKV